jgi:hypothetical protein
MQLRLYINTIVIKGGAEDILQLLENFHGP